MTLHATGSFSTRSTRTMKKFVDGHYGGNTAASVELKTPKGKVYSRLYIDSGGRVCRDERVGSVGRALKSVSDLKPRAESAQWTMSVTHLTIPLVPTVNKAVHREWAIMAGETNKGFSPLASPFTLRFMIEMARKMAQIKTTAIRPPSPYHEYFYRLMRAADDEGIQMCDDVITAWQPDLANVGYMGLAHLQNAFKDSYLGANVEAQNRIIKAFPPSILIKKGKVKA